MRRSRGGLIGRISCVALCAAALLAAPATQAQTSAAIPQRQVELPADKGLVVGHQARQGRAVLVELVPPGESVQTYTRMVTLQSMPGLGTVPERALLERFAKLYQERCPRSATSPLGAAEGISGIRIDCPLHPATGRIETVFVRALDLVQDRALVHITMPTVPTPEDSHWARDYFARVAMR